MTCQSVRDARQPRHLNRADREHSATQEISTMATTSSSSAPSGANPASQDSLEATMDWEPTKEKLMGGDLSVAIQAATELRDRIEIVHTTGYPSMLAALLPAFATLLSKSIRPNSDTSSLEQQLRNSVLEIMSRMPNNEVLRPYAPQILAIAMDTLTKDYEDNALVASRIIFDLHKNYRSMPQDQVQPYMDFVLNAYRALPSSVHRNFTFPKDTTTPSATGEGESTSAKSPSVPDVLVSTEEEKEGDSQVTPSKSDFMIVEPLTAPTPMTTSPSAGLPSTPTPRMSIISTSSFRVLTECPLTVMLLFQLYPKFIRPNITAMISVMNEALALRPPPLESPGETVSSDHKRMYFSRSRELIAAQVKTLSFLTQFLRGFGEQMKPFEDRIASNVVSLMTTCPRECISARRELLQATRHILATDFRKGLFKHVDTLLDERVLIGSHPRHSDQSVLRPLGYSALADLVHHSRSLLSMAQFSRVVNVFARVLHDSSLKLPMTIQITAVRLLLNIVDPIFHNKEDNPQLGRDLLVRILDALVSKLGSLKDYIPLVQAAEASRKAKQQEEAEEEASLADEAALEARIAMSPDEIETTLWSCNVDSDAQESIKDLQAIVRSIVVGLKTVIWSVNNYAYKHRDKEKTADPPPATVNDQVATANQKLTVWERELVDKYIQYALPCISVFRENGSSHDERTSSRKKGAMPEDIYADDSSQLPSTLYREVLTYFATAFTVLDAYNLRQTIGKRIDLVVDAIVQDRNILVVPRHLLVSNQNASIAFCGVLLSYLVDQLDELSVSTDDNIVFVDSPSSDLGLDGAGLRPSHEELEERLLRQKSTFRETRASTLLELFERVLKSLAPFPENEAVLRPYLQQIVATCLRYSMEGSGDWPDKYCVLLRYIFRSISAGKFEQSYKELLPLIPAILNGLYRIFCSTEDTYLRDSIVELCLTVPARLSSLLPHLPLLLRVIIPALQSSKGELVNLGYVPGRGCWRFVSIALIN